MRFIKLVATLAALTMVLPLLTAHALTINGTQPGGTGSMAMASCPTTTASKLVACATSTTCQTKAIKFDNQGTANLYIAPAGPQARCTTASPAPAASPRAGIWVAPNSSFTYRADDKINPADPAICAEWDMMCDGTGNYVGYQAVP